MNQKRTNRSARSVLRFHNVAVAHVAGHAHGMIDWRRIRPLKGVRVTSVLNSLPYHWSLHIVIFIRTQAGRKGIVTRHCIPQGQYRADQLDYVLKEFTRFLKRECEEEGHEVAGTGYLATPYESEIDESHLFQVFAKIWDWSQK